MAFFIVLDHVKMFIQRVSRLTRMGPQIHSLALSPGGEEGDKAAGQADAENVVDVGGGALQQWRVFN